jgi:hypothetical protein
VALDSNDSSSGFAVKNSSFDKNNIVMSARGDSKVGVGTSVFECSIKETNKTVIEVSTWSIWHDDTVGTFLVIL